MASPFCRMGVPAPVGAGLWLGILQVLWLVLGGFLPFFSLLDAVVDEASYHRPGRPDGDVPYVFQELLHVHLLPADNYYYGGCPICCQVGFGSIELTLTTCAQEQ